MSRRRRRRGGGWWWKALIVVLVAACAWAVLTSNWMARFRYPQKYMEYVEPYAREYGLEENFVLAVIFAESSFDPEAVSHAGARGLMQLMPDTGAWLAGKLDMENVDADDLFDPATNIRLGCYYLSYLEERLEDRELVLAAYNAGMGNVRKWLQDERYSDGVQLLSIPIKETENYVEKTLRTYEKYEELYP